MIKVMKTLLLKKFVKNKCRQRDKELRKTNCNKRLLYDKRIYFEIFTVSSEPLLENIDKQNMAQSSKSYNHLPGVFSVRLVNRIAL